MILIESMKDMDKWELTRASDNSIRAVANALAKANSELYSPGISNDDLIETFNIIVQRRPEWPVGPCVPLVISTFSGGGHYYFPPRNESQLHKRLCLATAIGHVVLHSGTHDDYWFPTGNLGELTRQAELFARTLLMPDFALDRELGKLDRNPAGDDLVNIGRKFDVGRETVAERSEALRAR